MNESSSWQEKKGSEREHGEERVYSTVRKTGFREERDGSKESLPRRRRNRHKRVGGRKNVPERSGESRLYFRLGQT